MNPTTLATGHAPRSIASGSDSPAVASARVTKGTVRVQILSGRGIVTTHPASTVYTEVALDGESFFTQEQPGVDPEWKEFFSLPFTDLGSTIIVTVFESLPSDAPWPTVRTPSLGRIRKASSSCSLSGPSSGRGSRAGSAQRNMSLISAVADPTDLSSSRSRSLGRTGTARCQPLGRFEIPLVSLKQDLTRDEWFFVGKAVSGSGSAATATTSIHACVTLRKRKAFGDIDASAVARRACLGTPPSGVRADESAGAGHPAGAAEAKGRRAVFADAGGEAALDAAQCAHESLAAVPEHENGTDGLLPAVQHVHRAPDASREALVDRVKAKLASQKLYRLNHLIRYVESPDTIVKCSENDGVLVAIMHEVDHRLRRAQQLSDATTTTVLNHTLIRLYRNVCQSKYLLVFVEFGAMKDLIEHELVREFHSLHCYFDERTQDFDVLRKKLLASLEFAHRQVLDDLRKELETRLEQWDSEVLFKHLRDEQLVHTMSQAMNSHSLPAFAPPQASPATASLTKGAAAAPSAFGSSGHVSGSESGSLLRLRQQEWEIRLREAYRGKEELLLKNQEKQLRDLLRDCTSDHEALRWERRTAERDLIKSFEIRMLRLQHVMSKKMHAVDQFMRIYVREDPSRLVPPNTFDSVNTLLPMLRKRHELFSEPDNFKLTPSLSLSCPPSALSTVYCRSPLDVPPNDDPQIQQNIAGGSNVPDGSASFRSGSTSFTSMTAASSLKNGFQELGSSLSRSVERSKQLTAALLPALRRKRSAAVSSSLAASADAGRTSMKPEVGHGMLKSMALAIGEAEHLPAFGNEEGKRKETAIEFIRCHAQTTRCRLLLSYSVMRDRILCNLSESDRNAYLAAEEKQHMSSDPPHVREGFSLMDSVKWRAVPFRYFRPRVVTPETSLLRTGLLPPALMGCRRFAGDQVQQPPAFPAAASSKGGATDPQTVSQGLDLLSVIVGPSDSASIMAWLRSVLDDVAPAPGKDPLASSVGAAESLTGDGLLGMSTGTEPHHPGSPSSPVASPVVTTKVGWSATDDSSRKALSELLAMSQEGPRTVNEIYLKKSKRSQLEDTLKMRVEDERTAMVADDSCRSPVKVDLYAEKLQYRHYDRAATRLAGVVEGEPARRGEALRVPIAPVPGPEHAFVSETARMSPQAMLRAEAVARQERYAKELRKIRQERNGVLRFENAGEDEPATAKGSSSSRGADGGDLDRVTAANSKKKPGKSSGDHPVSLSGEAGSLASLATDAADSVPSSRHHPTQKKQAKFVE